MEKGRKAAPFPTTLRKLRDYTRTSQVTTRRRGLAQRIVLRFLTPIVFLARQEYPNALRLPLLNVLSL